MCAAAGIPILPEINPNSKDGEYMDISEYEDGSILDHDAVLQVDDDLDKFQYAENDQWPVISTGYPLKERYLQLLCGSEDNESEQYYNVIDHWAPSDKGSLDVNMLVEEMEVVSQRKRRFELFDRDGRSDGDRSRPATEEVSSKRRWDGQWGRLSVVSKQRDNESE